MKTAYLDRMGIVAWRLRHDISTDTFFQVELKNGASAALGMIIAEIDSTVSVESQAQLLHKIAEAITVHYDCCQTECPHILDKKYRFIIFLGKI
jgi:hypothetical protein